MDVSIGQSLSEKREGEMIQGRAGNRRADTTGFDRLLVGIKLASLEKGPLLELPLVHPMTGWPTPSKNGAGCTTLPTFVTTVEFHPGTDAATSKAMNTPNK